MEFLGIDLSCAIGSMRDGNFPDRECLLPLVSKLLGYAIVVAASTTVKLPQVFPLFLSVPFLLTLVLVIVFYFEGQTMKILKHRSVRGLSVVAAELEVVVYTIALAYCLHKGLPFSAYAIILVAILYYYSQPMGTLTWIRPLIYCAVAPTVFRWLN